jgi:toxin ParE1/3/4
MNVRFSPQARADLKAIIQAIAAENPAAARRFGRLVIERALSLSQNPFRGTLLKRTSGVRRLLVGPYLILSYEVAGDRVGILQIVHGARDLKRVVRGPKVERKPD